MIGIFLKAPRVSDRPEWCTCHGTRNSAASGGIRPDSLNLALMHFSCARPLSSSDIARGSGWLLYCRCTHMNWHNAPDVDSDYCEQYLLSNSFLTRFRDGLYLFLCPQCWGRWCFLFHKREAREHTRYGVSDLLAQLKACTMYKVVKQVAPDSLIPEPRRKWTLCPRRL